MFNRRYLKLTVAKDKKTDTNVQAEPVLTTDYTQLICEVGRKALIGAVVLTVTYVVLDTVRQATVATIENHK